MKFPAVSLLREWVNMRRFNALDLSARSIVFYAEDAESWVHFEPIVHELTDSLCCDICYLTSSPTDPILKNHHDHIRTFYIGDGIVRTILFLGLKAGVLIMTMPDLETYHIKRSKLHLVRYVYVFHSMVSTHMAYRRGAFDHFDVVLCVGPHHVQEIRSAETVYGLKPKDLVEHGYGRLDSMLQQRTQGMLTPNDRHNTRKRVLVAPSWGPHGLLETHGVRLCHILLEAGFHVTVRPHPMTVRKWPHVLQRLRRFTDRPDFVLETDISSSMPLQTSDIMISDWSGVALEYAFVFEKPVLFVDVPRKVNNANYGDISCEPLEVVIREELGEVISPDRLAEIPQRIDQFCTHPQDFVCRIQQARSRAVYHVGASGAVGAAYIAQMANEVMPQQGPQK